MQDSTTHFLFLLGLSFGITQAVHELGESVPMESHWIGNIEEILPCDATSNQATEQFGNIKGELQNPATSQNSLESQNTFTEPDLHQKTLDLNYEPTSQSSFDPYGFKLSPEHSSHTLLDPDEAELSPEPADDDLAFDPEPCSSQIQLNFNPYGFDIRSSQMIRDSDPYGFKLSPQEENQEVLEFSGHDNQDAMNLSTHDNNEQRELSNYNNQEILKPHKTQELLENGSHENQELLDLCNNGNQEVLETSSLDNRELVKQKKQEVMDLCCQGNQEVVEPYQNINSEQLHQSCEYDNQPHSLGSQDLLDFSHPENQEVLDLDTHENQEVLDFNCKENHKVLVSRSYEKQEFHDLSSSENQELPDLSSHDSKEALDVLSTEILPEANNNQCILEPETNASSDSSDSDVASEDILGLQLSNISTSNTTGTSPIDPLNMPVSSMSANQDCSSSAVVIHHNLLEGDLGSVFGAGGYIGCPDVADDLESLHRRQSTPVPEPIRPVRPVRPPRPSLRVS